METSGSIESQEHILSGLILWTLHYLPILLPAGNEVFNKARAFNTQASMGDI